MHWAPRAIVALIAMKSKASTHDTQVGERRFTGTVDEGASPVSAIRLRPAPESLNQSLRENDTRLYPSSPLLPRQLNALVLRMITGTGGTEIIATALDK